MAKQSSKKDLAKLIKAYFTKYKTYNRRTYISGNPFKASKADKAHLKKRPTRSCSTCRKSPSSNKDYWIADHRPPVALSKGPYFLYPQCCDCSAIQSGIVKKKKSGMTLSAAEEKFINKPKTNYQAVATTSKRAGASDKLATNKLGKHHGCVNCKSRANPAVVADHYIPSSFYRNYVKKVFEALGLDSYLDKKNQYLTIQCWHCSNMQAHEVRNLITLIKIKAKELEITMYS